MMSKECSNAPKLDVIQKFETEPVSFIAKADLPSIFGKFTGYGFLEPAAVKTAFTKGGQINMWWGLVMLVFGVFMLLIARPRRAKAAS